MPHFLKPELYQEDCQRFEFDEDTNEDEIKETSLPDYIDCRVCSSEAKRNGNRYECSNDDCGWEGAIDDV